MYVEILNADVFLHETKAMRITFINRLAGIFWGGGETFDLEVARAFTRLGHTVQFLIGRGLWRLDMPMLEFPTTYVRSIFFPRLWYWGVASQSLLMNRIGWRVDLLGGDIFERRAFQSISKNDFIKHTDIFQINGLPRLGAWIRESLNAKSVIMWHGPPSTWTGTLFGRETSGPKVRDWNERCSATLASGDSVTPVRNNADSRVVEISMGVDTERFRRLPADEIRHRHHIPLTGIVFLFVGRMIHVKNLPMLITAFASVLKQDSRVYLLLVGDGPSKADLVGQVRGLGIEKRVVFAGRQAGMDLVRYYNAADVFTITSTYESYSFVVLEAMSCGLPVIATRVGRLPKSVADGTTGLLVGSGDVHNLKLAMLALAANHELRYYMGQRGRETVLEKHSWMETAKQMLGVYETL